MKRQKDLQRDTEDLAGGRFLLHSDKKYDWYDDEDDEDETAIIIIIISINMNNFPYQ